MIQPGIRVTNSIARLFLCAIVSAFLAAGLRAQTEGTSTFRVEKVPVDGGAEIITIFAKSGIIIGDGSEYGSQELPMVSVLRDTLGDQISENDRLRYVWMHTYSKPSFWQRFAGSVPFLYTRTTGRSKVSGPPPPLVDMQRSNKALWDQIFWSVFKRIVRSEFGLGGKSVVSQYYKNSRDHRRTAVASALTILALYQSIEKDKLLTEAELKDIQARLWLTDKSLGWHMQDETLNRVYEREMTRVKSERGTNWELLRQYAEAQRLYFDPIEMADGEARHAMVWVAADDLVEYSGRRFDSRFLNIASPWNDGRLRKWKGYTQTWWFDGENRVVDAGTQGARERTMIPLALYGLDNPKIPVILIDFRDGGNPRRREISRRVLNDVTNNVLAISKFSSIPYFVGRYIYDYTTGKRGMDLNGASRQRSYAQLKMLLALEHSLDDGLEDELIDRIERASINPMENDAVSQVKIAGRQYQNLMAYARRPDGLPAKLIRDRREEMVKLAHGSKERLMFSLASLLSLGIYRHREDITPEMLAKMNIRRQLEHHERVLIETAYNSSDPEIDSDAAAVRQALQFVAENGASARGKTSRALAKIFRIAPDDAMRSSALAGLYRINNTTAKKELLAIYGDPNFAPTWRETSARYLRRALDEGQRFTKRDAAAIATIEAN